MKTTVVIFALLGLSVALPTREKRQAMGCLSAFLNVPNLCMNNAQGLVFFQHPTDPTKYLQCDINNRMYIIQCPQNEVFNVRNSACQPAALGSVAPPTRVPPLTTTIPPPTTIRNFVPPQVSQQTPGVPLNPTPSLNPCTPANLALGKLYFPYPGDSSRFIECDLKGIPTTRVCPPLLQWDQNILSCMYQANTSQPGGNTSGQTKPQPQITAGNPTNPCTRQAIGAGHFYFPHPDPTKYIQCDMWGDAFVNSCPPKLNWNAYLETCYTPFNG